ncbi:hypothetical protein Btru_015628 [Bulinus truncatus]|nr:hypothetical protein Btru_015628 [Bulinus truncatus]
MEQESKPKRKKLQLEIMALKRDVHKYHTLYEKQKEYYEEKLQELMILEAKYKESENKCISQEKEIERMYLEHVELAKTIEIKNHELEIKKSELNTVVNNYQELSKILLLVDKHLQFLETENFVDQSALHLKIQDPHINSGNKNNCKFSSKYSTELDSTFSVLDKTILNAEEIMANRETSKNQCMLTSLEIEKERLARLLNHPQMGGSKTENLNVDNNNANKDAERLLKNSSVIWSTLEGSKANGVSTKDLIDKFKDKLQYCQINLKKEKEKNNACKEELTKLTDQLQNELESSRTNLEALKARDQVIRDHADKLEKENEKFQQELKSKTEELESCNQAIKSLVSQNKQIGEKNDRNQKQIKLLVEKIKLLGYVSRTRNKMYEVKLKQLMSSSCNIQTKLKSRSVQTEETHERLINDVSKYQLIQMIQKLLNKLIEKSEEVIKLETLLKKKSLFLENFVTQFTQKYSISWKRETDAEVKSHSSKGTLSSPAKCQLTETDLSDSDTSLGEVSRTSQEPKDISRTLTEEMSKTLRSLRKFDSEQNEYLRLNKNCENRSQHYIHNNYSETCRKLTKDKDSYQQDIQSEMLHNWPNYEKSSAVGDLSSCLKASKDVSQLSSKTLHLKNVNRKESNHLQKEADRIEILHNSSAQTTPREPPGEQNRPAPSPLKRRNKSNNLLQCESDQSGIYANAQGQHCTTLKNSQPSRQKSPDSDHSDATDEYTESSDQEKSVAHKKLGQEISRFFKQSLEDDRAQENNSLKMFKNAELYVILKGHRK